ncbi:MAG TPA: L,D-transpeptidase [Geobacter sp.]|nr:L,D-transpeptidase [Geobacter sp.]
MCLRAVTAILFISLISPLSAFCADIRTPDLIPPVDPVPPKSYVEISISGRRLTVYETNGVGERVPVAQYPVGTVARGLDTYPLGPGQVTGIYFDPWWYPTAYTREAFRERGIELPAKVPPGHRLNYMGSVKIALSHKTWKGSIYRIHGNNDPKRVGRRVTGGCFVMNNKDGLALARKIKVGTEVNILP